MSFIKTILIGNLGNDPELKYTPSGSAVCNLSVATTEVWTKDGQKQEHTEWTRCQIWGKQAENCNQYLKKGSKVFVEGKPRTRSWDDEKTGKKMYSTDIVVSNIQFLNSNKDTNEALHTAHEKKADYNVKTDVDFISDDIPF